MRYPLVCSILVAFVSVLPQTHGQSVQPTAAQAAKLYQSLRDAIDHGADVFNQQADYSGCYRIFEGALLSIKPFASATRAKEIDDGLAKAARMARVEDKAFQLRTILDAVREDFRVLARGPQATKDEPKKETKTPAEEKKPPEAKPSVEEPKVKAVPLPEKIGPLEGEPKKTTRAEPKVGHVVGTVSINGRPMQGGKLQLVAPVGEFTTKVAPNGEFAFPMMIPSGPYRVAVMPSHEKAAAPRFRDETTSGLLIRVRPEKQSIELNLVK
ncbi:MAG: hypothetical protein K2X38_17895 [Gemmataceae bacterium]|nr:hypothetical protein [Gemmataceae bacterium]